MGGSSSTLVDETNVVSSNLTAYLSQLWLVVEQYQHVLVAMAPYKPNNSLVIFNIDDTLLFSQNIGTIKSGLGPVIWLYHEAQRLGYGIILLTDRHTLNLEPLIQNLQAVGVTGYLQIIAHPPQQPELSRAQYKANQRALLSTNYNILASVSQNPADFGVNGSSNSGLIFKLPSYSTI